MTTGVVTLAECADRIRVTEAAHPASRPIGYPLGSRTERPHDPHGWEVPR